MGGCCFHVIVDYTIPCFIVAQKNRINNFIIIGQLICAHTYLSFWITEESFVLDVDIGLLCNLFFVKCVLFIGKLFSFVLVLGLQVPTLGIDLNFVSTNKLLTSSAPLKLLSRDYLHHYWTWRGSPSYNCRLLNIAYFKNITFLILLS